MKHKFFTILLVVTAIAVAFFAAYFSVFGLGQLFIGAWMAATILFSVLEFGKLVSISYLDQYWTTMNKKIRLVWTSMVIVFMIVTSIGIYGFLSSAYTKTASDMDVINSNISLIEKKIEIKNSEKNSCEEIIKQKNERITTLNDLRKNQERRLDSLYMRGWMQAARQTEAVIQKASEDIDKCNQDISKENDKITIINDSLASYEMAKVAQGQTTTARDVGTLKYFAKSIGLPMDTVVNILILLIMFVFDPFSVVLVIAANETAKLISRRKKQEKDEKKESKSFWLKRFWNTPPGTVKDEDAERFMEKMENPDPSMEGEETSQNEIIESLTDDDIPVDEIEDQTSVELPDDLYEEDIEVETEIAEVIKPELFEESKESSDEGIDPFFLSETEFYEIENIDPTMITEDNLLEDVVKEEPKLLAEKKEEENIEDIVKTEVESVKNEVSTNLENVKNKVKVDLEDVKTEVRNNLEEVKSDIDSIKQNVEQTKTEINANIDAVKGEIKSDLESVKEDLKEEIMDTMKDTMEIMFEKMKEMMESMNEDKKKAVDDWEDREERDDDFWDIKEVEEGSVYPVFNNNDYIANSEVRQVTRNYREFKNLKWISFPSATHIEPYIFLDCTKLESVDLPLVTTTEGSFKNCVKLKEVNMPKLSMVGEYTFHNCKELETLKIPNAKVIDDYAFGYCSNLEYLDISNANVFGDNIFDGIKGQKIKIKMKKDFAEEENFLQMASLNEVEFEFI